MNKHYPAVLALYMILALMPASAQEDMMALLQQSVDTTNEKTIATFKSSKLINIQTMETVKAHNMDVRITHLFGNIGAESGGGVHTLYGFDQSTDIRIGLTYGLTDRLNIGFSRYKRHENLVGDVKYKVLEQTTNGSMPFTLALWGNMAYTPKVYEPFTKSVYRFTYAAQAILARKFSSRFSMELVPSWVHRNLVDQGDENEIYSLGAGARCKVTRSTSLIVDYVYSFGRPEDLEPPRYDPFGVGFEIETGGHIFTLMMTNASGILENDYIANTVDNWGDGGMKFSFHITRMFTFQKKPQK